MTTGTTAPYRPAPRPGGDGFARSLRAEFTKFRTVRGWVIAVVAAALATVLLGVLFAVGNHSSCGQGPVEVACPVPPLGPGGEAVTDQFFFAHRPLAGDGAITVRVTSLTGIITYPPPDHDAIVPGVVPWAKAGVIIKQSTRQGSAYAAMMVTGAHGVRMQHDFTEDTAGMPGPVSATSPRWLRLTRSGGTLTGYESADGTRWTKVGTARLGAPGATVQVGLFTTSPGDLTVGENALSGDVAQMRFTQATAVFDHVDLQGAAPGGAWRGEDIGRDGQTQWEREHRAPGLVASGGTMTVTGSGDIAPSTDGQSVERTLGGGVAALIVVIVVGAMFVAAEYRRGLIRTTMIAEPRRGRVLAAKAVVIGTVTFAAGLAAAAVTVPICARILRANDTFVLPVSTLTGLRVVVGTAALLSLAAVLALALGALLRRGVAAVVGTMVALVLPYLLAAAAILPSGVSDLLMRITPAAAFSVQQTLPAYPQVTSLYAPVTGYFPLAPWAGLAVFCGYTALALGLAVVSLRRRDV